MAKPDASILAAAKNALDKPRDFDTFVAALGQRDRTNIERHVTALGALPNAQHAKVWKRLVSSIATLAPLAAVTNGQQAIQFFIADGKYRMQAFAIEDQRDGKISVYTPDALSDALKAKVIGEIINEDDITDGVPPLYRLVANPDYVLAVESLDAKNTNNPAPYFANMIGWNRKAMRLTLTLPAQEPQIAAMEAICALASLNIKKNALPAAPPVVHAGAKK